MKNFLKKDGLKILIAFVFIITGVIILHFAPGGTNIPAIINFVTTSLKSVTSKLANTAENAAKPKKTSDEYEQEIDQLKKEIINLRAVAVDYYDVKRENAQYLKLYKFIKQDPSFKIAIGKVIDKDPGDIFNGFTLDKGANDGVEVNNPVMTEKGIVGRVDKVFANSCTVKSILSPDFKIGVVDVKTGDSGVLMGNAKLADQNLAGMMYLSAQNTIAPDDIVVTSGLGGLYPKNLPVGKIKELRFDDFDSSSFAVVEPFNDIKNVVETFIITDFSGKKTNG